MADKHPQTHDAYALRRESRLRSRWIEVGHASVDTSSATVHHVFLDRVPIGGFTGHIYLSPKGVKPPDPEPHRPNAHSTEENEDI
jgi:hypothetical protein